MKIGEIMHQDQMCFDSFNESNFKALIAGLINNGYVIDGEDVEGVTFSSTQIEHLDQEMLGQLCDKFNISEDIKVSTSGGYSNTQGALYIIYNTSIVDYVLAESILQKHLNRK
jgi:hypothetical protein